MRSGCPLLYQLAQVQLDPRGSGYCTGRTVEQAGKEIYQRPVQRRDPPRAPRHRLLENSNPKRRALSLQALDIDLKKYIDSITPPEGIVPLHDRATALTERRLMDDSCKNDVISPDRFLAVNLQDCGLPLRETVLYRT